MKKFGFTLAEILITMGVIGIVAALAAPAVISASSKAKLGPSLSKASSSFESAAELLLGDEDTDSLVSVVSQGTHSGKTLGEALSKYMKLDEVTGDEMLHYVRYKAYDKSALNNSHSPLTDARSYTAAFISDNNMLYYISDLNLIAPHGKYPNITSNQKIGEVYVDVNGSHGPNTVAKDLFRFYLYNDGTLRPYGTKSNYDRAVSQTSTHWDEHNNHCNGERVVSPGWTCTGSIFDNNMKAIYK